MPPRTGILSWLSDPRLQSQQALERWRLENHEFKASPLGYTSSRASLEYMRPSLNNNKSVSKFEDQITNMQSDPSVNSQWSLPRSRLTSPLVGWKDGWMVKSAGCSGREPSFDSNTPKMLTATCIPFSPSSGLPGYCTTCTRHTDKPLQGNHCFSPF